MDLTAIIVAVVAAISGIVGTLLTIKYKRRQEKAKANQEEKNSEALTLKNTNEIVELYKKALVDMEAINEKHEKELLKKLEEQSAEIKRLNDKVLEYETTARKQDGIIEKLSNTQGILKLEIERLKKLSMDTCKDCEFKEGCNKYAAKQLLEKTYHPNVAEPDQG